MCSPIVQCTLSNYVQQSSLFSYWYFLNHLHMFASVGLSSGFDPAACSWSSCLLASTLLRVFMVFLSYHTGSERSIVGIQLNGLFDVVKYCILLIGNPIYRMNIHLIQTWCCFLDKNKQHFVCLIQWLGAIEHSSGFIARCCLFLKAREFSAVKEKTENVMVKIWIGSKEQSWQCCNWLWAQVFFSQLLAR